SSDLANAGVTVFEPCESLMQAIGALARFRNHQATQASTSTLPVDTEAIPINTVRRSQAIAFLQPHIERGEASLSEHDSKRLLTMYGIDVPPEEIARDSDSAVEIAERLGYPAVIKINSPDIAHNSDAGGLQLNLKDADAVRAAYREVISAAAAHHPHARLDGVLVTTMLSPGIETVVGGRLDAQFGPVL